MVKRWVKFLLFLSLFAGICIFCRQKQDPYTHLPKELAELNRQIDKHPKDAKLYQQRSQYYYYQGKVEEAYQDILQSIKLEPNNSNFQITLSDIYFVKKETDLAEEALLKAISLNPKNNEARLKLATLYMHLKMFTESETVLAEAVELQPHNPQAHIIRAFVSKFKGDTTAYIRMLQLAIDQDPSNVSAFLELGYFFQQKKDSIAEIYYKNALLADPSNEEINYNLGLLYQDLGHWDKAEEQYRLLLQISPNNKLALNNIGWLKLTKNEFEEAVLWFSRAIQQDSLFVNAICNRGISYEYLGDTDLAKKDYLKALQINPNYEAAKNKLNQLKKR